MTKEFYIIRQKTWHYSDQCYYLEKYGEEGAIYTTSFSYEEAKELWLKLERNAVREKLKFAELAFYDIIFNGDRDKEERFYDYLIDELKLPSDIREWDEITCFLFPPTNEQIDEIRKILGITFFVITQIENSNPNFYIPLANPICLKKSSNQLKVNTFFKNNKETLFFNSKLDALKFAYTRLVEWGETHFFEIKGSIKSLTTNPIILSSVIKDSKYLDYNEIDNILLLNGKDGLYLDDFLKVHSLLLEKPILVESISLFEASEMYKKIKIDEVDYSHLKIPTNNELLKLIEDWENYNDCSYYKN